MEEVLRLAISNGLFATLFTLLLFYVLRDAHKREKKYNETINKLTAHLGTALNDVKNEVVGIKNRLDRIGKKIKENSDEKT